MYKKMQKIEQKNRTKKSKSPKKAAVKAGTKSYSQANREWLRGSESSKTGSIQRIQSGSKDLESWLKYNE